MSVILSQLASKFTSTVFNEPNSLGPEANGHRVILQSRFWDFSLRDMVVRVKVPGDLVDTGDCVSLRSPSPFLVHLIYLFLKEKLPGLLLQGMQPFSGHSNGPLLIFPIVLL